MSQGADGAAALLRRDGPVQRRPHHNRYTLVNRSADALIEDAHNCGLGIVNAAVLGGGILAAGAVATARYAHREADRPFLRAVRDIEEVGRSAGFRLATAAIQFSARDPQIATTTVYVSRPERVLENLDLALFSIPEGTWATIDEIVAAVGPIAGPG